jgi:hypothetical protein
LTRREGSKIPPDLFFYSRRYRETGGQREKEKKKKRGEIKHRGGAKRGRHNTLSLARHDF